MMQTYSQTRHIIAPSFVTSNAKTLSQPAVKRVVLANKHSSLRAQIAHFIQSGFKKAYDATINVSMPYLVSIEQSQKRASLGFRGGHLPLFLEQYFDHSIEQHTFLKSESVCKNDIVEIGHLYSNSSRLTLPLFMVTALSLQQLGFRYLVFSATEKVKNIIESAGVELTYLVDARCKQLKYSNEDWGTYYQTNPKVYALSLENVASTIRTSPYYKPNSQLLKYGVNEICEQYLTQLTNQHLPDPNLINI